MTVIHMMMMMMMMVIKLIMYLSNLAFPRMDDHQVETKMTSVLEHFIIDQDVDDHDIDD